VVDVEERPLRALEEQVFALPRRVKQVERGVREEREKFFAYLVVAVEDFVLVEAVRRVAVRRFQALPRVGDVGEEFPAEPVPVAQVARADAGAGGLVGVGRPDAAPRGAPSPSPDSDAASSALW